MKRSEPDDPDDASRASEFADVFDRCAPLVLRFAWRRLGDQDLARDIVSDTFTVAWRSWDQRPDAEIVLAWLYAIAGNAIRDQRRASGRRSRLAARLSALSGPEEIPDPADGVILGQSVAAALARLPASDRDILRLVAWEHLDDAREVGLVLGISAGTARVRLHRARQRLRALLAEAAIAPNARTNPIATPGPDENPTISAAVQAPREGGMTCTMTRVSSPTQPTSGRS